MRVACSVGVGNKQRWWQWIGTLTERTGETSIVVGDEEIFKGDRAGNVELLGGGVCIGNQGSACAGRGRVVYLGVVTLEGRVSGEEVQEVRVAVEVSEGELISCDEWCEWEEKIGERRRRGGVSYTPRGWTSHVSTPARLSRSLLWPSTLSIRSGTCELMRNRGGIRSS